MAESKGQVSGQAEYEVGDEAATAEISVAVADGLHHRGVGTRPVEHLVSAARADGSTTFTADALFENHEVLQLFADLGLRTARRFDGPEVRRAIELDEDDVQLSAVEARGRAACRTYGMRLVGPVWFSSGVDRQHGGLVPVQPVFGPLDDDAEAPGQYGEHRGTGANCLVCCVGRRKS